MLLFYWPSIVFINPISISISIGPVNCRGMDPLLWSMYTESYCEFMMMSLPHSHMKPVSIVIFKDLTQQSTQQTTVSLQGWILHQTSNLFTAERCLILSQLNSTSFQTLRALWRTPNAHRSCGPCTEEMFHPCFCGHGLINKTRTSVPRGKKQRTMVFLLI